MLASKDINTERIREVMTALEDLASINGRSTRRIELDMLNAHVHVDSVINNTDKVCFSCWLDMLNTPPKSNIAKQRVQFIDGVDWYSKYIINKKYKENKSYYLNLVNFLEDNPDLWGNSKGEDAFLRAWAYKKRGDARFVTLGKAIKVWRDFANRLDEERNNKP